MADGFPVGKSRDLLACFIHESDLAVIVCSEDAIGNAIEDYIKEFIGLSSFHGPSSRPIQNHTFWDSLNLIAVQLLRQIQVNSFNPICVCEDSLSTLSCRHQVELKSGILLQFIELEPHWQTACQKLPRTAAHQFRSP
jgi:hypothetical protein